VQIEVMPDLELRQWDPGAAAPAAQEPAETPQAPAEQEQQQQPTVPPDLEERLRALEEKLKEVDWAFKINEIAKENPQLASDLLQKAADLYRQHAPQQNEQPSVDFNAWLNQLEQMVSNPPVDPEWMSEEAKWMYQVAKAIVDGLKASYQASQQFWQQWLARQEEAELSAAEEAALQRVEEELEQLKSRLGAAYSEKLEEQILNLMEKIAEEEDRLVFPLEAYGILVARGEVPAITPAATRVTPRPAALQTFPSAPGATMRPSRRVESIDDAIKQTFNEFGIPI
jgi:hypothetical protein